MASSPDHKMTFLFHFIKMTCEFRLTKWPLYSNSQKPSVLAHKKPSVFHLAKSPLYSSSQNDLCMYSSSQNALCILAHKITFLFQLTKWPLYGTVFLLAKSPLFQLQNCLCSAMPSPHFLQVKYKEKIAEYWEEKDRSSLHFTCFVNGRTYFEVIPT